MGSLIQNESSSIRQSSSRSAYIKPAKMVKMCKDLAELKADIAGAGDKLVVVDFFAEWCGPCKKIAPIIEGWSKEMSDVVFLKVDVDVSEEGAEEYNVSAMPTFIFFQNGVKIADMMGANEGKLKEMIDQNKQHNIFTTMTDNSAYVYLSLTT